MTLKIFEPTKYHYATDALYIAFGPLYLTKILGFSIVLDHCLACFVRFVLLFCVGLCVCGQSSVVYRSDCAVVAVISDVAVLAS